MTNETEVGWIHLGDEARVRVIPNDSKRSDTFRWFILDMEDGYGDLEPVAFTREALVELEFQIIHALRTTP